MSDIRLSRRRFLGATAGGAAALATAGSWAPAARAGLPKAHIAIQMWSVRDMFAADPAGTLAALADIGYVEIELAGIPPGHTAASLRALLDDVGSARTRATTAGTPTTSTRRAIARSWSGR